MGLHLIYKLDSAPVSVSKDISYMKYEFNKLYISSAGNDPYFELPNFWNESIKDMAIRIDIEAKAPTYIQIFYAKSNEEYTVDNSFTVNIIDGKNVFITNINSNNPIGRIRIDTGVEPADYVVNSVEVYASRG